MSTKIPPIEVRYKITFEFIDKAKRPFAYNGKRKDVPEDWWELELRESSNIDWIHAQIRELHKQPLVRNIKLFKTVIAWIEIHPQDFD